MKIVESAILSTDLAVYFKKRNSFLELVENGEFDWQGEDKKESMTLFKFQKWRDILEELNIFQFYVEWWWRHVM